MNEEFETIEDIDEETDKMIKKYAVAYATILSLLLKQIDKGWNYRQSASIIKQIDNILLTLDKASRRYITKVFTQYYLLPIREIDSVAVSVSGAKKISGAKHAIHREALRRATNDLYGDLARNTQYMSQEAKKIIRDNAKELLTGMIESGESQKTIKKKLRESLIAEGIPSFKDAGRRKWKIDRYADMVIRTKSRIIHNEGTLNRLKEYRERYEEGGEYEENFDLIQISDHGAEDWCSYYEDMIFSVSGNHPYYPSKDTLPNQGYETLHPNCKHVYLAYMPAIRGQGKRVSSKYQSLSMNELNKIDYAARKKKSS